MTETKSPADKPRRPRVRRWFLIALVLTLIAGAVAVTAPYLAQGDAMGPAVSGTTEAGPDGARPAALTIMSLNLAHGRKTGFHQALLRAETIKGHLQEVAGVLREHAPDFVGLQEADGPSLWSGRFDHVAFLAKAAGFHAFCRGEHVRGLGLRYGTGCLSRRPMSEARSYTFRPSPPTPSKGFVVASFPGIGPRGQDLTVVSVHLDFARKRVRRRQAKTIIKALEDRGALVVMGDFNTDWGPSEGEPSSVRSVAEALSLRAYQPADAMPTFPTFNSRLDWILISDELKFESYEVLPDEISDHRAVLAKIAWK